MKNTVQREKTAGSMTVKTGMLIGLGVSDKTRFITATPRHSSPLRWQMHHKRLALPAVLRPSFQPDICMVAWLELYGLCSRVLVSAAL